MPSVSRQQQKAMFAAAEGKSTLGIPKKVGQDFAAADIARGPVKLPKKAPVGNATGLKSYAGSKDKNANVVKPAAPRVRVPTIAHPGDAMNLPNMHTSKHN